MIKDIVKYEQIGNVYNSQYNKSFATIAFKVDKKFESAMILIRNKVLSVEDEYVI